MSDQAIHSSSRFINVTPSDTALLKYDGVALSCNGISFATAGALAIKDDVGNTVVFPNGSLAAGVIHQICTSQVLSTGTGALNIVAYF